MSGRQGYWCAGGCAAYPTTSTTRPSRHAGGCAAYTATPLSLAQFRMTRAMDSICAAPRARASMRVMQWCGAYGCAGTRAGSAHHPAKRLARRPLHPPLGPSSTTYIRPHARTPAHTHLRVCRAVAQHGQQVAQAVTRLLAGNDGLQGRVQGGAWFAWAMSQRQAGSQLQPKAVACKAGTGAAEGATSRSRPSSPCAVHTAPRTRCAPGTCPRSHPSCPPHAHAPTSARTHSPMHTYSHTHPHAHTHAPGTCPRSRPSCPLMHPPAHVHPHVHPRTCRNTSATVRGSPGTCPRCRPSCPRGTRARGPGAPARQTPWRRRTACAWGGYVGAYV